MPDPTLILVGHCTSTTASVFCCTDAASSGAPARLFWRAGERMGSEELVLREAAPYHLGTFRLEGLPDGATIEYGIDVPGEGGRARTPEEVLARPRSFRLLPTDRPLRVALVSCNGFAKHGNEASRFLLWEKLRKQVDTGKVDVIVHAGDQIYADPIWETHDTDHRNRGLRPSDTARVAELAEAYRRLYVRTWSNPEVADVLAACPNLMTWDDHDIFDGYGSHDDDGEDPQQAFLTAAQRAYEEFQTSHGPGPLHAGSFLTGFTHNGVGIVLLDTRSNRMWTKQQVLGDEQFEALKRWGAAHAPGLKRLYVVSSIPLVHAAVSAALTLLRVIPGREGIEDDLRDAWVASNNRNECHRLAKWLFSLQTNHPELQVTVLAGDVHVATVGEIRSSLPLHRTSTGQKPRIHQVTSSGIGSPPPEGIPLFIIQRATRSVLSLGSSDVTGRLMPVNGSRDLVLARRNFAVLNLEDTEREVWDPYGNLHVSFHVENRRGDDCDVLPQVLNGPG